MKGFEGLRANYERGNDRQGETGWESVSEMAGKFEENLARNDRSEKTDADWMREAAEQRKFEEMKDGIEQGLEQYADTVAEIEKNKTDKNLRARMNEAVQMTKYNAAEHLRAERVQEIIEKDLNERLTKVEDLELKAKIGGLGVTKTEIDYNGQPITVYNMQGAPLRMLTTSIDYKNSADKMLDGFAAGSMTMHRLKNFPALWLNNRERMKLENERLPRNGQLSDTVSCSYTDVNKNPDERIGTTYSMRMERQTEPDVVYGWDGVEAGSIMRVGDCDLRTPQAMGDRGLLLGESHLNIWDDLENSERKGGYNEVVMSRFKENGEAKPPKYLATENSMISEDIKCHAAFHKAPIINVEREYYDQE